jgi:hypothetical protein
VFTTIGGLVGHYEEGACAKHQQDSDFKAQVQQRTIQQRNTTAARNYVGNRFGDNLLDEPLPALRDYANITSKTTTASKEVKTLPERRNISLAPNSETGGKTSEASERIKARVAAEEDLISFDEVLNSDWNATNNTTISQPVEAFPGLPSFKNPMGGLNIMDDVPLGVSTHPTLTARSDTVSQTPIASTTKKDSGVKSVTTASPDTTIPALPTFSQFDPFNPHFKAGDHYIQFTGKYRCPHRGCMKTFVQQAAFIQHLRSPAHNDVQFQCHGCLRYFVNATALAQHASDQGGVRCRVRETDNYEREVNRWTAGHVMTYGPWDDNTIRYVATGQQQTASDMAANHKAKLAEKNKSREEFWLNNTPAW